MIHIVDTHVLIRYIEDYERLGPVGRAVFADPAARLIIPTIVLAEARFITARHRVEATWDVVLHTVEVDRRFDVSPLTVEVLRLMPTDLEMHDAIVCATALALRDLLAEDVRVIHPRPGDHRLRPRGDRLVIGQSLSAGKMGLSTSEVGDPVAGLV